MWQPRHRSRQGPCRDAPPTGATMWPQSHGQLYNPDRVYTSMQHAWLLLGINLQTKGDQRSKAQLRGSMYKHCMEASVLSEYNSRSLMGPHEITKSRRSVGGPDASTLSRSADGSWHIAGCKQPTQVCGQSARCQPPVKYLVAITTVRAGSTTQNTFQQCSRTKLKGRAHMLL